MRTLQFSVDKQKLSKNGDFSGIIRGTKGYLKCDFAFNSNDWAGYKVVAVFEKNKEEFAVAVRSGSCTIPNEVTDGSYFKVRLVGAIGDNRITTNRVLISQEG